MKKFVIAMCLTVLSVACGGPRYVDYFPYHDDGRPKPKVAIVTLKDASSCKFDWEFSDEMAEGLYCDLMNSGQLYVMSTPETGAEMAHKGQYDFFNIDANFAHDFCGADFVAILELIENAVVPYDPCTGTVSNMNRSDVRLQAILTRVRVKVVDIRCQTPRTVLCEVVKAIYPLEPGARADCVGNVAWGTDGYYKTSCGMAHYRAIKQLSERLENIIQCSR